MKRSILLALFSIGTFAVGQEKHRLEIESQIGYEHNYFKSPDRLLVNDTLVEQDNLIASSSYLELAMDYRYRYKWKGNRLRFAASPFARLFQENPDDSYWSLDAMIDYEHRISKKTKFLVEIRFKRMAREGLDGAQDLLVNPLGYTNYGATTGMELRLFKNNKTVLEGFYNFKDFDEFGVRDLQFSEYGLQLRSKQSFKPERYAHSVGLSGYYKKRLYDTFNGASSTPNGRRDWDYAKATAYYSLPINSVFEVRAQFSVFARFDRLAKRSGFNQYGPGLRLAFDNDKTKIAAGIKYQMRDYNTILAPGTSEALRYQYMDVSLGFEHRLPIKNLLFTGTAYSRFRETNTVDLSARSFRGYTNQYVGLGIKYGF